MAPRSTRGLFRLAVAVAGLLLVASACGDDTATSIDDPADGIDTAAEAADVAVGEAEQSSDEIVDVLRDNGMSSLASAIETVDFSQITSADEYTFLAPSDEAFLALSADEAADILGDPEEVLRILRNHVITEILDAQSLSERSSVETEAGNTLPVSTENGEVTVGGVAVSATDIEVSDGIVHVVDGLLIP